MFKNLLITALLLLNFSVLAVDVNLTPENHVLLNGDVSSESMAEISSKLLDLSITLPETETIYLVINSGGGSVYAGMNLISVMEIIPQKIVTVSMFAFSMAYSISQRGDERLIAINGIMGQHRAKGSFSGQFSDGEVEQRLKLWTAIINSLNIYEANKMEISLEEFKKLTKDEMYLFQQDAVDKKVADGVAVIKCSKELIQNKFEKEVSSYFGGKYKITYSSCPLIKNPIKVEKVKDE